jgi:mannan polymerase II complex MNN10 subunit
MAERLIKSGKYDWIWWLDFDTLVTNTDIKVTDIIDEERSLKFLRDSWDIHDKAKAKDIQMSEQDSTVKLMKEDALSASRVHVVPQWKLNAFPKEIACFDKDKKVWEHGTFILHFAGAWAHVKGKDPTGQLMKKYENEVIWGDWKEFY